MEPVEKPQIAILRSVLFWALALIFLLCCIGDTMLYAAEARYAEAVREMYHAGDWLHPTFNGMPLSPRPLFMHWMMLLCCFVNGTCNEISLRLPGVLAGLLTLFAVRRIGSRLFSLECGRTAGYLLLGCFGFLFWSRSATAEMWNTCVIAVGMMWFYELREKPGFWNLLALFIFFLLGTQFKGVYAASALGVLLLPELLGREFWGRVKIFRSLAALLLALALFAWLKCDLSGSVQNATDTLFDGVRWSGGKVFRQPFFYFRELPLLLLPWTAVLMVCPAGMLRNWKKQNRTVQKMLCGALLMLVMLTLLPWTQGYYALGLLVPLTLCSAAALIDNAGTPEWNRFVVKLMQTVITATASAATASLLFLPFWKHILGYHPPRLLLFSILLVGIAAMILLFSAEFDSKKIAETLTGIRQEIAVLILAGDLLCGGFVAFVLPQYYLTRTELGFLSSLRKKMEGVPSSRIVYWGNPALRFLFYFGREEQLNTVQEAVELKAFCDRTPGELWLLTQNSAGELEDLAKKLHKLHITLQPNHPELLEELRPVEQVDTIKFALFKLGRTNPAPIPKAGL